MNGHSPVSFSGQCYFKGCRLFLGTGIHVLFHPFGTLFSDLLIHSFRRQNCFERYHEQSSVVGAKGGVMEKVDVWCFFRASCVFRKKDIKQVTALECSGNWQHTSQVPWECEAGVPWECEAGVA